MLAARDLANLTEIPMKEPYSCRIATMADLPVLVRLLADDELGKTREHVTEPLPASYSKALREILSSKFTAIHVVEADGAVIGSLQVTVIPNLSYVGQTRGIFESVHVLPEWQGKGAGAFLVNHAIDDARQRGVGQIVLTSSLSRTDAHRFWKRHGFDHTHVGMKLFLY
jgi:GNAT superfamily N-acetyltransferase